MATSLAACGGSDAPTVRNDLFAQPDNDNTCGIRQTLLTHKVLQGDSDYFDDILAMWRRINEDTRQSYPDGIPSADPIELLNTRFMTQPLPEVYTQAAVEGVEGGPQTLPSAILHSLKEDGFELVRFYLDEDSVDAAFQVLALVDEEVELITETFPQAERVNIDVGAEEQQTPALLQALRTQLITNADSYYIVIVNGGSHWIGVTPDKVFNSIAAGPVDNTTDFGFVDGDSSLGLNSVTGLIMEIQRAP
jgi:hypothetical protein